MSNINVENYVVRAQRCPHYITVKYFMVHGNLACRWCRVKNKLGLRRR